jgi:hypothetical protein
VFKTIGIIEIEKFLCCFRCDAMYEHFITFYYVGSKKGGKCRKEGQKERRKKRRKG